MSRSKISFDTPKTTFQTDAIQSSEPFYSETSVKESELKRRLKLDLAKKEARDLYRRDNIYKTRVMNMSDEEIDNILLLQSQLPKLVQDNRTNQQREEAKKAFKHQEELLELEKQIDQADAVMSVSTDYIPVIGSLLRAGQYNLTRDTYSPKYARNKYGVMPAFGAALDLATLPFGLATKSLASSYAGGMVGRYIGDEYYDNPFVGLFIGTLLGHPTYNIVAKTANKANRVYLGYRLGRAVNNGINNTQFINLPVEHVSPNGITNGSALDVGEEGIHLSPAGSETTINILKRTGYPFVRTGTWTFSNNTRPESVLDLGYFGRGFNLEFDSKVDRGIVNFKYINNFEGNGNQSFLTTEPSFGLLLSKNVLANKSRRFVFNIPLKPSPRILAGNLGVITTPEPMVISPTDLGGHIDSNNFNLLKNKLTDLATELFILPWEEQLRQFYNSGFYARRLAKAGLLSKRDHILQWKNKNLDRTLYGIGDSSDLGSSYGNTTRYASETHPRPYVLFNTNYDFPIKHTVIHEGSHASSLSLPEIRQHNNKLLENVWEHVRPEMRDNPQVKEYIDYITDAKIQSNNENALVSEIGGLLLNAFLHMLRNNLTPDLLLSDIDYISRDHELRNAIAVFTPSYLKKLLAPGGIISSVLLAVNNKNDDKQ